MAGELVEWSSLLGFFSESDAIRFVREHAAPLDLASEERVLRSISIARNHVASIRGRRELLPRTTEIPREQQPRLEQLQREPSFGELRSGVSGWSFGLVDLPQLHVYQPHVNLGHVEKIVSRAPDPGDTDATMRFCLPLRDEMQAPAIALTYNSMSNTFSLVSDSSDLRVLGSVSFEQPKGRSGLGFLYGFGHAQMSVVEYGGIMFLKNGYHRAYALMRKGHTKLPCVILRTDNFDTTGMNQPMAFPLDLLMSDHAPVMEDFFSKAAVATQWRKTRALLTVHAGVEIVSV